MKAITQNKCLASCTSILGIHQTRALLCNTDRNINITWNEQLSASFGSGARCLQVQSTTWLLAHFSPDRRIPRGEPAAIWNVALRNIFTFCTHLNWLHSTLVEKCHRELQGLFNAGSNAMHYSVTFLLHIQTWFKPIIITVITTVSKQLWLWWRDPFFKMTICSYVQFIQCPDFIITNRLAYILPAGTKILAFDFTEALILIKQSKIHLQLNGWEGRCVQCTLG